MDSCLGRSSINFPRQGGAVFQGSHYPWHILMAQHLSQRIAILSLPVCHSQEAWAPLNPLPLCSLASSPVSQQTSEQIKRRCVSVIATCVNSEDVSLFARSLLALWLGQPSRNFLACSTGMKWFSRHVVTWSVQFCGMKETLDCQREQALPERRIEVDPSLGHNQIWLLPRAWNENSTTLLINSQNAHRKFIPLFFFPSLPFLPFLFCFSVVLHPYGILTHPPPCLPWSDPQQGSPASRI